ncbi:hypothetical protein D3C72_1095190 [compost metagenome]
MFNQVNNHTVMIEQIAAITGDLPSIGKNGERLDTKAITMAALPVQTQIQYPQATKKPVVFPKACCV